MCNTLRVGYFTCDRQVWLCGEVVTVALKDRFTQLFPHVQLLNLYSISECHDITCSGKLIIIMSCSFRRNCVIDVLRDKLHGSTAQWPTDLSQISLSSCMPGCETQFLTELLMKTEVLWSVMLYQITGLL